MLTGWALRSDLPSWPRKLSKVAETKVRESFRCSWEETKVNVDLLWVTFCSGFLKVWGWLRGAKNERSRREVYREFSIIVQNPTQLYTALSLLSLLPVLILGRSRALDASLFTCCSSLSVVYGVVWAAINILLKVVCVFDRLVLLASVRPLPLSYPL